MRGIYSFSGSISSLALDIVPAYVRKTAEAVEEINEEKDYSPYGENVRPYSEVFDRIN